MKQINTQKRAEKVQLWLEAVEHTAEALQSAPM